MREECPTNTCLRLNTFKLSLGWDELHLRRLPTGGDRMPRTVVFS